MLDPEFITTEGDSYQPPSVDDFAVTQANGKDIFSTRRKSWHEDTAALARCDFAPNKATTRLVRLFRVHCLWKKSLYGRTLAEIKSDSTLIEFVAANMAGFITQSIGNNLHPRHWVIVTPPKRRHLQHNFASIVAARIAEKIGIAYLDDVATCRTRQRINPDFTLEIIPAQHNVIIFDDFITTASTMTAMHHILTQAGKNTIFFAAVNNS